MAAQTPLVSQRIIISQPTMMLTTSLSSQSVDESIIREQVLSTHNPDGREFDTNFILSMAEKTINLETGTAHQKVMVKELNQLEELDIYKELSLHIRQLSFEIASGAIAKNQHYSTTIHHLLSIVSPYCWEDKLVLMIAAFSIIHGESSLISRLRKGKGLVGKLAHLKQSSHCPIPTPSSDKNQTAEDYCCISSAIELTKCVVQLKQCLSYSPPQSLISALPMAAYWIATTVVDCAAYTCDPHFKIQNEHREITTLMATFSAELAKKKSEESYEALRNALYHGSSDKLEVFKLMFNVNDDDEIIFHRKKYLYVTLRLVMLLITSGVGVPNEWIRFLNWFHENSRPHIIWIPITQDDASWSTEYEQQCDKLRNKIWFSWLKDPKKMLWPQFTRFVKEELFQKGWGEKPIIASFDRRGRIVHPNVIHMMLTWSPSYIQQNTIGVKVIPNNITLFIQNELKQGIYGIEASSESSNFRHNVGPKIDSMTTDLVHNIADKINAWKKDVEAIIEEMTAQSTPYDSEKEKILWQQQTWTLHLLAPQSDDHYRHYYTIGMPINDWIREEKYIFLYGGNNIKWIREFLCKARMQQLKDGCY
ncbi:uncharacterized protein LOC116026597 isoform X2 [Ipomoea triloba]|uniref:uncharacterized protein LOC116026597 isoform X2 n=1 Tax=Ipomoea triloba TaxID=35885 RepID=UPI00125D622C|nr:uncharacterized protein LOC116026597 isoform X2 [Ipomoea triloba]